MTFTGPDLPDHVHGIFRKYKNPVREHGWGARSARTPKIT